MNVSATGSLGVTVRHEVDMNWAELRNQMLILMAVLLGIKVVSIMLTYALEK